MSLPSAASARTEMLSLMQFLDFDPDGTVAKEEQHQEATATARVQYSAKCPSVVSDISRDTAQPLWDVKVPGEISCHEKAKKNRDANKHITNKNDHHMPSTRKKRQRHNSKFEITTEKKTSPQHAAPEQEKTREPQAPVQMTHTSPGALVDADAGQDPQHVCGGCACSTIDDEWEML